jgi:hypothetical protein
MRAVFYFENILSNSREDKVLSLALRSFQHFGWETAHLTEADAKLHPKFKWFDTEIRKLPTINDPEYTRQGLIRYLAAAMRCSNEDVLFDHDVICNGLVPGDFDQWRFMRSKYQFSAGQSCLWGNFEWFIDVILNWRTSPKGGFYKVTPQGLHTSDMNIRRCTGVVDIFDECLYGDDNYWLNPIVHFSNNCCLKRKQERLEAVQSFLSSGKWSGSKLEQD